MHIINRHIKRHGHLSNVTECYEHVSLSLVITGWHTTCINDGTKHLVEYASFRLVMLVSWFE